MTCPKCSATMDEGFLLERGHGNSQSQTRWIEGPPTPSFWPDRLKLKGRTQLPVSTYRCNRCGYLESYAAPESSPA